MAGQKIRIRLKSYDHAGLDASARKIVDTVTRAGATVVAVQFLDAVMRLAALKEFLLLPDAGVLAAINKRIANILKKTQVPIDMSVDPEGLTEDAERELQRALMDLRGPVLEATSQRRYADSLQALVGLRAPVNDFFDRVMVMDENTTKRDNRLALLRDVQILLGGVADLSRLPG